LGTPLEVTTSHAHGRSHGDRPLEAGEWRVLAVLGLPTFAYALATTIVTTYLPVLAATFSGGTTTVIGLLIGVEGLMALLIAVPAGGWSDRRASRLPFVMLGTPVLVAALVLMGFSGSMAFAALWVVVFFAAYFVAYEPYRALYPDLVDDEIAGRAQSTQALWRGLGTFAAIGAGGALFALGKPLPFVVGGVITAAAVVVFLASSHKVARERAREEEDEDEDEDVTVRDELRRLRGLLREHAHVRSVLYANALWELSLGALKTFIILYLTKGMGLGITAASLAVAAAAVFILGAAGVGGKLGDRFGRARVMQIAVLVYGIGLLIPFLVTAKIGVAAATPLIAFGGGILMSLPYALLQPLMPEEEHGLSTGLYSLSRGIGTAFGPLLAGVAIQAASGLFTETKGYQAMFGVCAVATLASLPFLSRLRDTDDAD
jgi:MFS family permease